MLTTDERKQICKELKLQAKGIIPAPIKNITLSKYHKFVAELGGLNFYIPPNQTLDFGGKPHCTKQFIVFVAFIGHFKKGVTYHLA